MRRSNDGIVSIFDNSRTKNLSVAKMLVFSHRFRSNDVRLCLTVLAYNLGNLWRRLVLPQKSGNWSLTSLQLRLEKPGGRLIMHARCH
jgi:Transposase DDE domain group 1